MKHYLIIALLVVATVSTASAGDVDWLADARSSGVVASATDEACRQRGGSWVTLMPRKVEGNPWAKSKAPVSGCWEPTAPLITFAEGPPINILECEWRKLFEDFIGAKGGECYVIGKDARTDARAYTEAYATIAGKVIKRRGTNKAPPPAAVPVIPMQKLRGIADI